MSFPSYVHDQSIAEVVEVDSEMLTVAEKWFGFAKGERMSVHIADGIAFINERVSTHKEGR